ncbi:16709_t:CDS:1, partial [Gigaspora margarita]
QIDPISISVIQRLNANVSRFDESMTYILLYDSEKLENPLTKCAEACVKNVWPDVNILNDTNVIDFIKNF